MLDRVSDLRPIIISGVKMLDFSFTWFSVNYFINCIEELRQGAKNYTLKDTKY